MPIEGHGMDCDCGCCDVEAEPQAKTQGKCVCSSCGKEIPAVTEATTCAEIKCPFCGAYMQPGIPTRPAPA